MIDQNRALVRISNVWMYIHNLPEPIKKEVQTKMSYFVPGFQYMARYQQQKAIADETGQEPAWDGTKTVARRSRDGGLVAPVGLFSYLKEVLVEHNIPYFVRDERLKAVRSPGWSCEGVILRDYQGDIKKEALRVERGVMKLATGGGKTKIMMMIMVEAAAFPAVFYVPSCDLLQQTFDEFSKHVRFDGKPVKIGRVGDGHCDVQPITIATVQSCQLALENKFTKFDDESATDKTKLTEAQKAQVRDMVREAQFVYVDEAQHVSCETIQTVLNNSYKARFRIGGSASPWRDDGLDILIEACFGRRFCDIDASFLIGQGFLIQPQITFNHFHQQLGPFGTYQACYTKYVVENDVRNQWIAERALYHMGENRPTIILVKWARHAEILAELIPGSEVLTSSGSLKKSASKRNEVLNDMRAKKLRCIIGTTLLDEGVDVPAAIAGIFAGGGKSSTRALQRVGRFIRLDPSDPNKNAAYIEEFYDHVRYLDHHARSRRKILQTERLFQISDNRATLQL